MSADTIAAVVRLMTEVSETGPVLPEYDGLRVFNYPERMRQYLTGRRDEISPVTLDLWPSLSCNARCPLCQYRVSGARDEADRTDALALLPLPLADRILKGAAAVGVCSVILTGGGEPTLHPRLEQIGLLARSHGLAWGLNTNGFAITPQMSQALIAAGPAFIKVSVDAGDAKAHSAVYHASPDQFQIVVDNVIGAIRTAANSGARPYGLSFNLGSKTTDAQLERIRQLIEHISIETNGELGFAVFRSRLLHYRGRHPVAPQPGAARFAVLADRIEHVVIAPLAARWSPKTRFDIKKGLFLLGDRKAPLPRSLSSPWVTTVTHEGEGYLTAELAGSPALGLRWGRIRGSTDFARLWLSEARKRNQDELETGSLLLPLVHRTSPVDEFLHRLENVLGGPMHENAAEALLAAVGQAAWYRSRNSVFV